MFKKVVSADHESNLLAVADGCGPPTGRPGRVGEIGLLRQQQQRAALARPPGGATQTYSTSRPGCFAGAGINPQPGEGVRAAGARGIEQIVCCVIPQLLPLWLSFSPYRFESNVRLAFVIDLDGARGIGQVLREFIRAFKSQQNCAVMPVIVTPIDALSQQLSWAYISRLGTIKIG